MSAGPGRGVAGPAVAAPAARVRRTSGAPVVSVRAWLPGGARGEAVPGLAHVTGRMLAEGSRRRDWREIADRVEARGMILQTLGGFESHGLAIDALAADWEAALDLAAELLLEPAFPADRCAWVARQAAAELDSLGDQPEVRTAWGFLDQLYHPHRRALPLQGTAADLAGLTAADCAAFHRRGVAAGPRLAVAGPVDPGRVAARARELFAGVAPGGAAEEPAPAPAPAGRPQARRVVALPAAEEGAGQAHLYLGHLTIDRRHPDLEALELAGVVLGAGAGLTGRVPERIREREGLAYTASAAIVAGAGLDPGRLVVYVGTSPETVERAERAAREEIERLVTDGATAAELESARAWLLGREPFRHETSRQWADLLAEAEHYGLPLDRPEVRRRRLEEVTAAEVAAALQRHVDPARLRVTVGLPGGARSEDLSGRGGGG